MIQSLLLRGQRAERDVRENRRSIDIVGGRFDAAGGAARVADADVLQTTESEKGRRHLRCIRQP